MDTYPLLAIISASPPYHSPRPLENEETLLAIISDREGALLIIRQADWPQWRPQATQHHGLICICHEPVTEEPPSSTPDPLTTAAHHWLSQVLQAYQPHRL